MDELATSVLKHTTWLLHHAPNGAEQEFEHCHLTLAE